MYQLKCTFGTCPTSRPVQISNYIWRNSGILGVDLYGDIFFTPIFLHQFFYTKILAFFTPNILLFLLILIFWKKIDVKKCCKKNSCKKGKQNREIKILLENEKKIPKIEIFVKDRNCCQKSKFLSQSRFFDINFSFCKKIPIKKIVIGILRFRICQSWIFKTRLYPKIRITIFSILRNLLFYPKIPKKKSKFFRIFFFFFWKTT